MNIPTTCRSQKRPVVGSGGTLIMGQNPASSEAAANALIKMLG